MSNRMLTKAGKLDRRQFLAVSGGLLLSFTLEMEERIAQAQGLPPTTVNAWIRIGSDESITVLIGSSEMGQGIYSGLAQAAAEELLVDWARVQTAPAPANISWLTGGSSSIRRHFQPTRVAAAAAREMLIAAAAQTWGVLPAICKANLGRVLNTVSGVSLTYGQLAQLASTLPVPVNPPLVPTNAFRLIGQSVPRTDIPAKTNGSAKFGLDAFLPGMVFAVIKHCPSLGGTLKSTPAVPPGASAVVPLDNAVAIVASNTWQAMQAAAELQANWSIPTSAKGIDSALYLTQAQKLMASGPVVIAEQTGDINGAFQGAAHTLEITYSLPYLAHACMEVLNCTVQLTAAQCDIWVPTQAPGSVLNTAVSLTGLPASKINVHPTYMGGGLGRKFEQDYVIQAIRVAKALGKPVKLTWSREEDMAHDQYRPMALIRVRVALDAGGNIKGWAFRNVSPSILFQRGFLPTSGVDSQAVDGATKLAYAFGSRITEYARHPATVPVGFWRSVGNSINAFAVESALDEIAAFTNTDSLQLRRQLLANDPRSLAVLNAAASLGGWGTTLAAGHARGIAFTASFGSVVAQVAEISQPAAGNIKVHKVACAIDCGSAVNPNSVEAQMQGGIFHGLSAALWGQVTFTGGKASARNFSNYRVLRMNEAPVISVRIVQTGAPLGGVGEPGVPPIAPAVANAYARLTGTRVRALPFFSGGRMGGG